jgi:hypothetical protein
VRASTASLLLLAALAVAVPAEARRDKPGRHAPKAPPAEAPAAEATPAAGDASGDSVAAVTAAPPAAAPAVADAGKPEDVVVTVNGLPITRGEYRKTLADTEFTWKTLVDLYGEDEVTRQETRQELFLKAELVEPLLMLNRFRDQDEPHHRAAQEAYDKAKAGGDWGRIVSEYSTEPGTKGRAGDVGLVSFENLVYPYNRIMFSAPLGEVQPPVRSVFGWHVGKVAEIVPARSEQVDGKTVRHPEMRRIQQVLVIWEVPEGSDLRLEVWNTPRNADIEVVDRGLCGELPHMCGEDDRQKAKKAAAAAASPPSGS